MIKYILIVTFLSTGDVNEYQFESKAKCVEVITPVRQLYADLKQPVKVECRPRTASISPASLSF